MNPTVRIAAVGDLHYGRGDAGKVTALLRDVHERADVLVLCGDLTDYGTEEETQVLARDLAEVRLPVLAVLGNHDHESGRPDVVERILRDHGVRLLDGENVVVCGVGFAGTKGFGGGFGNRSLDPWGEKIIKDFVQETVDEMLKLEKALARLHTPSRIAVLHYAPVQETVLGEPPEIWPFLGSSRLGEVLDSYEATAAFHGHAHHGQPLGSTRTGVPVYNVAYPVLRRHLQGQPPLRIIEVEGAPVEPRESGEENT